MRFTRLTVRNFFSFREAELDLADRGLVLVVGKNYDSPSADSNGSGKSALLTDAIPWCLFGMTARQVVFGRDSAEFKMDDVVNRQTKADCMVQVDLEVDGRSYSVIRYRRDSEHGNGLILKRGSEDLSGESIKETETKVVELLGLNYQSLINSMIFGQGAVKRFTQCTDAERRKVLESFLRLDRFTKARERVKADKDGLESELEDLKRRRENEESELAGLRAWQEDIDGKLKEQESVLRTTAKLEREREDRREELDAVNRDIETETARRDDNLRRKRELDNRLKEIIAGPENKIELEREISRFETKLETVDGSLEAKQEELVKIKPGRVCKECKRPFTEEHIKQQRSLMGDVIKGLKNDRKAIAYKIDRLREELQELDVLLAERAELEAGMAECDRDDVGSLNVLAGLQRRQAQLNAEITELDNRIKGNRTVKRQLEEDRKTVSTQIKAKMDGIDEMDDRIEEIQNLLWYLRFWMTGFSERGIKEYCYSQVVDFLNLKLEYFSGILTGGEISVKFQKSAKDRIDVVVDIPKRAGSYLASSGGQSKRIDLCVALSFQSLVETMWGGSNISVFDEIDASLDEAGISTFVDLLEGEARRRGTVFAISHNSALTSRIPNILKIVYADGYSRIYARRA